MLNGVEYMYGSLREQIIAVKYTHLYTHAFSKTTRGVIQAANLSSLFQNWFSSDVGCSGVLLLSNYMSFATLISRINFYFFAKMRLFSCSNIS